MAYRRLNEQDWELIWACFPDQVMGRPRKWSDRDCLDAILYLLHSGGPGVSLGLTFHREARYTIVSRCGRELVY